jgi:hypothetical protein
VRTDKWQEVDAENLIALIEQQQVDILLNPGAQCSMRLIGDVVARKLA